MSFAIDPSILLQTKIRPPRLRSGLHWRARLQVQLERILATRLTLVRAPAGYGKTTFLRQCAELLERRDEIVAWVSFDRSDNRPDLALAYLSAAFGVHDPDINDRMAPHFERLRDGREIELVSALINVLAGWNRNVVLILDDLHALSHPALHEALRFFIKNSPAAVRFVLSSRETLPLDLDRLPDPADVAVIDAGILKFTEAETIDLVTTAGGIAKDATILRVLVEKTEGWIAAIQLVMSSVGEANFDIRNCLSGSNPLLFDYLASAVLSRQDPQIQSFLLQTAPLGRFTANLCEAITANTNAHRILKLLEDQNVFLIPLDNKREWFRYHALFAEFLLAKLELEDSHDRARIHAAASRWFQGHGLAMEALQHALAAEDADQVTTLLDGAARQSLRYSQLNLLVGWLDQLPPDAILRAGVNATLAVIWAYIFTRHFDKAQALIDKVSSILDGQSHPAGGDLSPKDRPCLELAKIALERFLAPDRDRYAYVNEIRGQLGANWNLERALADIELGHIYWRRDELEKAYVSMLEARAQAEAARYLFLMADVLSFMAEIRLQQGRLADSQRLCEEVVARFSARADDAIPASGFAHLVLAEIRYEQGRLEDALENLRVADRLNRQRNSPDLILRGKLLEARVGMTALQPQECAEHLLEITNTAIHEKTSEVANQLYGMQISALARAQNLDAAEALLISHGVPVRSPGPPPQMAISRAEEPLYLALGVFHLASGKLATALNWLRFLMNWHRFTGREIAQARSIGMVALCHRAQGRTEDSMRLVRELLQMGERLGLCQTILDLGSEVRPLLQQYCEFRDMQFARGEVRQSAAYARALLDREGIPTPTRARQSDPNLAETGRAATADLGKLLSRREHEVLRLVGKGMTNQEIADELLIAVTSVKWHVKNIFSKLDVSSRTHAVARARDAGVIG